MKLCKFCNSSKNKNFQEGECFLCGGALLSLPEIAETAANSIPGVSTFSVSTKIPNEWLVREEFIFDLNLSGSVSIKTFINRYLSREVSKLSKKKFSPYADVTLLIDIVSRKAEARYNDLFVFGRYKKLVPGLSQTKWTCKKCNGKGCEFCKKSGKLYHSVEDEIGSILKKTCKADDYTMHASGREDIDVINTAGRPFIMQLRNAKARKPDFESVSKQLKKNKKVEVVDFKIARRNDVELVSASHFDKTYQALVEFEKEISDADIEKLLSIKGKTLEQRTPTRVKHRRADIIRKREIIDVKILSKGKKSAEIELTTEPGTYIKELVSGDEGRTQPSFSSVLGFSAKCKELKVTGIRDDFLNLYF